MCYLCLGLDGQLDIWVVLHKLISKVYERPRSRRVILLTSNINFTIYFSTSHCTNLRVRNRTIKPTKPLQFTPCTEFPQYGSDFSRGNIHSSTYTILDIEASFPLLKYTVPIIHKQIHIAFAILHSSRLFSPVWTLDSIYTKHSACCRWLTKIVTANS